MTSIAPQADPLALLLDEELFALGPDLARAVCRRLGSRVVTAGSLFAAARDGAAAKNGERIKLVAVRIGRKKWTSVAAVLRWIRACEAAR
jgi:hypothetical protein